MIFFLAQTPTVEIPGGWATAIATCITALAFTAGLICQIILQLMARKAAKEKAEADAKVAVAAKEKAEADAKVAVAAQQAAQQAATRANDVKNALVESNAVSLESLEQVKRRLEETISTNSNRLNEVNKKLSDLATANTAKLDDLATVAASTHTLVNNNMSIQLKLNAELSKWKASQTGLLEDKKASDLAEMLYQDHLRKQATVDAVVAGKK